MTKYTQAEHARRGTAVYEEVLRPQVEAGNHGKIVALDVDSGVFEVAEDTLTAAQKLLSRQPDAQIWCVRISYPAVHHFGQAKTVSRMRVSSDMRIEPTPAG